LVVELTLLYRTTPSGRDISIAVQTLLVPGTEISHEN
jgi:hypothetical protein